jgi:hypothetical protein
MLNYLKARAREAGTWRALAMAGVAAGLISQDQAALYASVATSLIAVALPEK